MIDLMKDLIVDLTRREVQGDEASATFSPDRAYRYALTRRWSEDPTVVFVMCNPSTADALVDDATIRRCVGFAKRWGGGGLLVVNAFGLRATEPSTLRGHPDPVGPDNDDVITSVMMAEAERYSISQVIAAWGVSARLKRRDRHMAAMLNSAGARPFCLGLTAEGQPRHPLYVPAAFEPIPYSTDPVPIVEPVTSKLTFRTGGRTEVVEKTYPTMAAARLSGRRDVCMNGAVRVQIVGADGELLATCARQAGNYWHDLCRGKLTVTDDRQTCSCGGTPTVATDQPGQFERSLGWSWSCNRCGAHLWSHVTPGGINEQ